MNTQMDKLLITSAPQEVLLFLAALFITAAIVCLVLAFEAGHYRDLTRWMGNKARQGLRKLRHRRRWLFIPMESNVLSLSPRLR